MIIRARNSPYFIAQYEYIIPQKYPQVMVNVRVNNLGKLKFYADEKIQAAIKEANKSSYSIMLVNGLRLFASYLNDANNRFRRESVSNETFLLVCFNPSIISSNAIDVVYLIYLIKN